MLARRTHSACSHIHPGGSAVGSAFATHAATPQGDTISSLHVITCTPQTDARPAVSYLQVRWYPVQGYTRVLGDLQLMFVYGRAEYRYLSDPIRTESPSKTNSSVACDCVLGIDNFECEESCKLHHSEVSQYFEAFIFLQVRVFAAAAVL